MANVSNDNAVVEALKSINRAWLEGRYEELASLVHEQVVAVAPGFAEHIRGRDPFVAGYRNFMDTAVIQEFEERDFEIDVIGDTAVASYRFEMKYVRSGQSYIATGRDLYVFHSRGDVWLAVWRTMLDVEERVA